MTNIRRRVFKPRTVQLLAMLLEAGMDGATTKHLSECLGARYPENQRHFIARNTAALLSGMRGKYVELVEKGVWRVCIVPPVTPVTYARKARLSSYD